MNWVPHFASIRTLREIIACLFLVSSLVIASWADSPEVDEGGSATLKHLSLEQLGDVEVTTASKEP
jgi:hypothetical protein